MTLLSNRLLSFSAGFIGIGQVLISVQITALFFSPPLVNLSEFFVYLIVLLVPQVRDQVKEFLLSNAGRWFFGFILIILLGALWSWFHRTLDLGALISWRKILMLPIAAALFKDNFSAQRSFLLVFLVVCSLAAVISLCGHFMFGNGSVVRNYSTQSMFFSAGVITALFLILISRSRLSRLIYCGTLLVILSALVFATAGRSGYLALLSMLTAFFILAIARLKSPSAIGLGAVVISILILGLVFSPLASERIWQAVEEINAPVSHTTQTSLGQRKLFWSVTVEMLPEHFIMGSGTASFEAVYSQHIRRHYANTESLLTRDPHNQFLKIWIEHGLIGLFLFLAVLLFLARNSRFSPYGALGVLLLIGWMASSLFNSHFSTFSEGRFVWIWLGVLLSSKVVSRAHS